jgi:hypothetical protein
MNREGRLGMIEQERPRLSLVWQCALLNLSRSSLYYRPTGVDEYDLELIISYTASTWRRLSMAL